MPRLLPPPGCTTAGDAAARLGVSEALLSRYVKQGKLKRYGPEKRQHKFYKISEIEALAATERYVYMPGAWRLHSNTTFEQATESDMPAIVEISKHIFDEHNNNPVTPAEIRAAWLRKNPETFFVLRNKEGVTVGYASLLPLKRAVLDRFIHDEIATEDITAEDIETFAPGQPLHLYFMSMGIEPSYTREKHEYGAALVRGLFTFFLDLASRGIELETITARSHKPDGLRLLRKLGIPQLRSPVPGKNLFAVRVAESGFPLFERYSEILAEYKHSQGQDMPIAPTPPIIAPARQKAATSPRQRSKRTQEEPVSLPPGYVLLGQFAHGISDGTLGRSQKAGAFSTTPGNWRDESGHPGKYALSPEQQAEYYQAMHTKPGFTPCERCPHSTWQTQRE